MSGEKPIIGITPHYHPKQERFMLREDYVEAIEKSGGVPLILPFGNTSRYLQVIDGLLVTGGGPGHVIGGEDISILTLDKQNPKRYKFEKELIISACKKNMPVLGICRGAQMIAQIFGGELFLDVKQASSNVLNHYQNKPGSVAVHDINIKKDSLLYSIIGSDKLKVNSFHRQSIKCVSDEFRICAVAVDGVVEAIEHKERFILGLQFHPERLFQQEVFKNIFDLFLERSNHYKK